MITIALDLGTTTGWAILLDGEIISGHESFKPKRFQGGGMRFVKFRNFLAALVEDLPDTPRLYFEEVRRHLGVDAAHAYGGYMAVLTAYCDECDIPYQGVPVGTIKKHATGKGNANKAKMIEAAKAKWGQDFTDDNEVDARWLLDYVTQGR